MSKSKSCSPGGEKPNTVLAVQFCTGVFARRGIKVNMSVAGLIEIYRIHDIVTKIRCDPEGGFVPLENSQRKGIGLIGLTALAVHRIQTLGLCLGTSAEGSVIGDQPEPGIGGDQPKKMLPSVA